MALRHGVSRKSHETHFKKFCKSFADLLISLNWGNRTSRLTTFGFILCIWAVTIKIAHLVWFSTRLFRRFGELCQCIIRCTRRECEIADVSLHRGHCLSFSADVMSCVERPLKELPVDGRHSGDNTMLSMAMPPYAKSLIAAMITIYDDGKFNRGRRKSGENVTAEQFHPNTKSCRSFISSSTLLFSFFVKCKGI